MEVIGRGSFGSYVDLGSANLVKHKVTKELAIAKII